MRAHFAKDLYASTIKPELKEVNSLLPFLVSKEFVGVLDCYSAAEEFLTVQHSHRHMCWTQRSQVPSKLMDKYFSRNFGKHKILRHFC